MVWVNCAFVPTVLCRNLENGNTYYVGPSEFWDRMDFNLLAPAIWIIPLLSVRLILASFVIAS